MMMKPGIIGQNSWGEKERKKVKDMKMPPLDLLWYIINHVVSSY